MKRVSRSQLKFDDKDKKVIKLKAAEEGGYVSKPDNFCYLFESHYEGTTPDKAEPPPVSHVSRPYSPTLFRPISPSMSTMPWSASYDTSGSMPSDSFSSNAFFDTESSRAIPIDDYSSQQVQGSQACSTLDSILFQLFERPFDKWFTDSNMPQLEATSDSDNQSSGNASDETVKR
eukprot:scaffold1933_cov165-Amphora_coffeaeformis.AAC.17